MPHRFLLPVFAIIWANSALAGAWLQPEGEGLWIAQATYFTSSHYYDTDGTRQSQPRFTKREMQPYAEYGLREFLTIGGTAYVDHVAQSGDSNAGIADPEIFARVRLWKDEKQILSIQPLLKFSSYFANGDVPRAGSRSTDAELSLLYGRNQPLLTENDYTDIRIGYRVRNRGFSDQLRFDSAIGFKFSPEVEIIPALRGVMAIHPTESATYSESGEYDYSLMKAELTGIYHLNDQQSLNATLFKHVAGVQTGDGYGITLGYMERF